MRLIARSLAVCAFLAWLCTGPLPANPIALTPSGGLLPFDASRSPVRMVWETIRMDVYPRYYTVDAVFLLEGPARPCRIRFGFPEGTLVGSTLNPMSRYRASIDGHPLAVSRQWRVIYRDGRFVMKEWQRVSTITLAPRQRRLLHISYRFQTDPVGQGEWAGYDFTGGNWRGRVDHSDLTAVFHCPGAWRVSPGYSPEPAVTCWHGNRFFARWRNWEAEGGASFEYCRTITGELWQWQVPEHLADTRLVCLPGEPTTREWQPEYAFRGQTVFASLAALGCHFEPRYAVPSGQVRPPSITWDAAAREGSLVMPSGQVLTFQPGAAEMRVDGRVVPLPAVPFLDTALYVPLQPVLDLVGQRFILYREARTLRFVPK